MTLNVSLDVFEGPFDLLFHLIEKNRIDIYDIPIAELTEQYLDYIGDISKNELDLTSGFLVMAATLLSIKSRMLLPSSRANEIQSEVALTVDEDPRSDLMTRLLEYKKYEEISNVLKEKEQEQRLIFKKDS